VVPGTERLLLYDSWTRLCDDDTAAAPTAASRVAGTHCDPASDAATDAAAHTATHSSTAAAAHCAPSNRAASPSPSRACRPIQLRGW